MAQFNDFTSFTNFDTDIDWSLPFTSFLSTETESLDIYRSSNLQVDANQEAMSGMPNQDRYSTISALGTTFFDESTGASWTPMAPYSGTDSNPRNSFDAFIDSGIQIPEPKEQEIALPDPPNSAPQAIRPEEQGEFLPPNAFELVPNQARYPHSSFRQQQTESPPQFRNPFADSVPPPVPRSTHPSRQPRDQLIDTATTVASKEQSTAGVELKPTPKPKPGHWHKTSRLPVETDCPCDLCKGKKVVPKLNEKTVTQWKQERDAKARKTWKKQTTRRRNRGRKIIESSSSESESEPEPESEFESESEHEARPRPPKRQKRNVQIASSESDSELSDLGWIFDNKKGVDNNKNNEEGNRVEQNQPVARTPGAGRKRKVEDVKRELRKSPRTTTRKVPDSRLRKRAPKRRGVNQTSKKQGVLKELEIAMVW